MSGVALNGGRPAPDITAFSLDRLFVRVAWHFMRACAHACANLFPRSWIFSEKTMSHAKGNHFSTARILISTGDYFHCQVCNISFPHWSKQASNRHLQFLSSLEEETSSGASIPQTEITYIYRIRRQRKHDDNYYSSCSTQHVSILQTCAVTSYMMKVKTVAMMRPSVSVSMNMMV